MFCVIKEFDCEKVANLILWHKASTYLLDDLNEWLPSDFGKRKYDFLDELDGKYRYLVCNYDISIKSFKSLNKHFGYNNNLNNNN